MRRVTGTDTRGDDVGVRTNGSPGAISWGLGRGRRRRDRLLEGFDTLLSQQVDVILEGHLVGPERLGEREPFIRSVGFGTGGKPEVTGSDEFDDLSSQNGVRVKQAVE